MAVSEPVEIEITPILGGLDISKPATKVDASRASDLHNVRFRRGQLTSRAGFSTKHQILPGADTTIIASPFDTLGTVLDSSLTPTVYAFNWNRCYYVHTTGLLKAQLCGDGTTGFASTDLSILLDPISDHISVDYGVGGYDFAVANGGNLKSNSPLVLLCTKTSMASSSSSLAGGVMVGGYLSNGVSFEVVNFNIVATTDPRYGGPKHANACAIFAYCAFVGGADDSGVYVQWSAPGRWDGWNASTTAGIGAGYQYIGDSSSKITAMKRMGDYLAIYKEDGIWICRKTGISGSPFEFSSVPTAGIGCVAPRSVAEIGNQIHAFLGPNDVYAFTLSGVESMASRVKDNIFTLGPCPMLPEYASRSKGFYSREYNEYLLMVPSGRMPQDSSDSNKTVTNRVSNPTMLGAVGASAYCVGWTADSAPSAYAVANGGLFSKTYQTVSWADVNHYLYNTYNYGGSVATKKFSGMAWVGASTSTTVGIALAFLDSGGSVLGTPTVHEYTVGTTALQLAAYETAPTGAYRVSIRVIAEVAGVTLSLHGAQIVDMTSVDKSISIMDLAGNNNYIPAYKTMGSEFKALPLIASKVGPWMPDTLWVYSIDNDAWSCWTIPVNGIGYDSVASTKTIAELVGTISEQNWRFGDQLLTKLSGSLLLGTPDGSLQEMREEYRADYATMAHEDSFTTFWESKSFDFGQPSADKTFARLTIRHDRSHPPVSIVVAATADDWANSTMQTITLNALGNREQTYVDFFITGPHMRFRITSESGISLKGFAAKVILRGEQHQYD